MKNSNQTEKEIEFMHDYEKYKKSFWYKLETPFAFFFSFFSLRRKVYQKDLFLEEKVKEGGDSGITLRIAKNSEVKGDSLAPPGLVRNLPEEEMINAVE